MTHDLYNPQTSLKIQHFQIKIQNSALPGASNGGGTRFNLSSIKFNLNRKPGNGRQRDDVLCTVHYRDNYSRCLGISNNDPNACAVLRESQTSQEVLLVSIGFDSLQASTDLIELHFKACH